MLMPLRDCFIHLRSNIFLFTAFLESFNYTKFEVEVLSTIVLTKKVLLQLFDKYFNLLELKLIAEEKIKQANKTNPILNTMSDNKIKNELYELTKQINDLTFNTKNSVDLSSFLQKTFPNAYNAITSNSLITTAEQQLANSLNSTSNSASNSTSNVNNVINITDINNYLKSFEKYENQNENQNEDKNKDKDKPEDKNEPKNEINLKEPYEKNNVVELPNKTENLKTQETFDNDLNISTEIIKTLPKNSEVYVRIYDPMNYKQEYRGKPENRPSVCTSLGQTPLVQPIFTESKLLFQGTDLNTAFQETQVGSIMPKFIYKEYQDIRIN
jgi:hypothetical protein